MTRMCRFALVVAFLVALPGRATAQTELINVLAQSLDAPCYALWSFAVQVKGATMCLHDNAGTRVLEGGRRYHLDRLKAMGLTLAFFTKRTQQERENRTYWMRAEQLAQALNRDVGTVVRTPPLPLRQRLRTATAARTQFRLSTATIAAITLALNPDSATIRAGISTDPILAALALRTITYANALEQQSLGTLNAALTPRLLVMAQGDAFAAEAGRLEAEANAMRTYLAGANAQVQGAALQLLAYEAMRGEGKRLRRYLTTEPYLRQP